MQYHPSLGFDGPLEKDEIILMIILKKRHIGYGYPWVYD